MEYLYQKAIQYTVCIAAGLLAAFETTIDFFMPCLLSIVLDIISAWFLGRRVHRKHPELCDGKFKSEYKFRVMYTLIIIFIVVILSAYVDRIVLRGADVAVRFSVAMFLAYELWSCLENWSSENDKPWARVLQRIMVNKAERHLSVPLADLLLNNNNEKKEENEKN